MTSPRSPAATHRAGWTRGREGRTVTNRRATTSAAPFSRWEGRERKRIRTIVGDRGRREGYSRRKNTIITGIIDTRPVTIHFIYTGTNRTRNMQEAIQIDIIREMTIIKGSIDMIQFRIN
jgi:hypothetical protein